MTLFLVPFIVLLVAITAWLLRFWRRRLMSPSDNLKKLYPHETDSIEKFASPKGFDYLVDDKEFWIASNGWKGLWRKRHNAVYLVQFCQSLILDVSLEKKELKEMTSRAILISFYIGCSVPEALARFFIKEVPHSFARNATNLYWEMERRATTLCSVHKPDLLDQLHQIL